MTDAAYEARLAAANRIIAAQTAAIALAFAALKEAKAIAGSNRSAALDLVRRAQAAIEERPL